VCADATDRFALRARALRRHRHEGAQEAPGDQQRLGCTPPASSGGALDGGQILRAAEAKMCMWSGRRAHPDDLRVCSLTGIPFHVEFAAPGNKPYLEPLADLLHGVRRTAHEPDRWDDIASKASTALRNRCRVETAHVSPDKRHIAICSEVRTFLGLRVQQAGLLLFY